MAEEWKTIFQTEATNQIMAAGASEFFLSNESNRQQFTLHGQAFNALEIVNDADEVIDVDFDPMGTDTARSRRRIFGKGSLVIEPRDGFFFSVLKLTNRHATTANAAGEIKILASIKKRIE